MSMFKSPSCLHTSFLHSGFEAHILHCKLVFIMTTCDDNLYSIMHCGESKINQIQSAQIIYTHEQMK